MDKPWRRFFIVMSGAILTAGLLHLTVRYIIAG